MADDKDPRIITPLPESMVAAIDDYRFENRLPSRAEAIRRLIEMGLESAKAAGSGGGFQTQVGVQPKPGPKRRGQ